MNPRATRRGQLWTPRHSLTRRRFLTTSLGVSAGLAAGASVLASCGNDSSGTTGSSSDTLDFWQWYAPQEGGGYAVEAQNAWFLDLVEEWNQRGGVQIRLTYIPISEYIEGTQLQSAFSAGTGPDIFVISPGDFLRYHNGDVLYDLTDALGDNVDDFYASALSTRTVDGRIYGIPMESEPLTMFYSVQAFEDAGLSEGDIPRTWEELLDVAEKLTTGDQFGVLFETTPNVYQNFTWYPFLWQAGGDVVDESGLSSAFDSPATAEALGFWQDAIERGVAPRTMQGGGGGDLVANLASGYTAMAQMVTAGGSFLEEGAPDFEYGMFPHPVPDLSADPITDMGGWAFCVNKNSAHAEAAAEFCAWALAGDESVDRMVDWAFDAKKSLPVRKSVMQQADDDGLFEQDELMAYAAFDVLGLDPADLDSDDTPFGRGEPRFTPEVVRAVTDAIQAAQLNGTNPAAAAGQAHEEINAALAGYDGAPLGS
ncbi:ABC transporter substrate-binding protein [Phytoactinopolyspora mesophila]|uniref:Extracellular solute-binding protein n=1 Tax=Phytoactinopolyspora mesophila TaxID=2650750 RepID=A0A7K3MBW7_9ACTN|nr:sugar ABC transporter substrate-binding protein [Phytoactinopolyspora mesophila]NDL59888.1 extracellular solute-binding protein [Phytoactinopolyspora mesophila]